MKLKLTTFLVILAMAIPSPQVWAESIALQPLKNRYTQLKPIIATDETTPDEIQAQVPFQAFKDLILRLSALEPKDHNEILFYLLNEYQRNPDRRVLISLILSTWQRNTKVKASDYISPSNWSDIVKGGVAILVTALGVSIVRGRFVKPPTALLKQNSDIEKPFTQAMRDRIAQMTTKQALKSGSVTLGTGIGLMIGMEYLLDDQFLNHLYDADLPIWLQEMLLLTKIPPSEMMKFMNVKIICAHQLELEQMTYYNEFEGEDALTDGQKHNLSIFKNKIEKHILPDLESLDTEKTKANDRFLMDGFRPKKDAEFKARLKNLEVKSIGTSKRWEDLDFSCGQVTLEGAIYNANRILEEIKIRTNSEN